MLCLKLLSDFAEDNFLPVYFDGQVVAMYKEYKDCEKQLEESKGLLQFDYLCKILISNK